MFWYGLIVVLTALFSFLFQLLTSSLWFLFLWIPISLLLAILLTVVLYYFVAVPLVMKMKQTSKLRAFFCGGLANFLLILTRTKVKVNGKENIPEKKNILYVSNHKSLLDPLYVFKATKTPCVTAGKSEIWTDMKYLSYLFKSIGILTIDRNNDRSSAKEIIRGINILKEGSGVLIFPEGGIKTREVDQMVSIKAGAYKLATKSKAIILPMAIHGNKDVDNGWFKKKTLTIDILAPIYPEEYEGLNTTEIGHLVLERVNQMYDEEPYELEVTE